jgi:ATP-dependent Clp protease, protease subunit
MKKGQLNDFHKYLTKKANISSLKAYNYFNKSGKGGLDLGLPVDIFQKLLEERIIFLDDDIDSDLSNMIKAQLLYLDSESHEDISLYIDSGGGSIYTGLGLLDIMDYIKSDICTVNIGLAASMAAVILCSGEKGKRKSLKRSRTMIHQPLSFGSWVQQASEVEIEAKEMNYLKKELYEIISEKTGQPYDQVYKDGDRDYWMSAKDALNYGLIDKIIKKK